MVLKLAGIFSMIVIFMSPGVRAQERNGSGAIMSEEFIFPFQNEHVHGSSLVVLPGGRILLPLYSDGFNFSMAAISDDDGNTWRNSLPIVGRGPIQPAFALKRDGTIVAYMRDSGDAPNRVQISTSSDKGESWTVATRTDIPNEASVEICVLKDGKWAFFGNDISDGRYQLSLYLSDDEGASWKWKDHIEFMADKTGSFSYPCMIQTGDGFLNITYSYSLREGKKTIKHVVIDPEKLLKQ